MKHEKIKYLGNYYALLTFITFSFLLFFLFRIILCLVFNDRIHGESISRVFTLGMRADFIIISYVALLFLILTTLIPKKINVFLNYIITLIFSFLIFMEVATIPFMKQYDLRPDNVFFAYLTHPKEVMGTLVGGFLIWLILGVFFVIIISFIFKKILDHLLKIVINYPIFVRILMLIVLVPVFIVGARSGIGHNLKHGAKLSTFSISNNHLINEITLNSSYSMLYAVWRQMNEGNSPLLLYSSHHLRIDRTEIFKRVGFFEGEVKKYVSPLKLSFTPNVVVILEESLGAEYVGVLGGRKLTPNIDELSKNGMLFTKLYSTGTRSVKGIEGIITGLPPTPTVSVVNLSLSRRNFFSAAQLFKQHDYIVEFLYGGEGDFDGMRSFFLGNGFDYSLDRNYFENANKKLKAGVWGIHDEDLLLASLERFKEHKKPFFSLIFTTSNHIPFDFPADKIKLFNSPKQTPENGIVYADYALGEFFRQAKKEAFFKNTIFVVIADHNTRVYGNEIVPIDKFRILGLMIGPNIPKMKYKKVASQIDILPTVLHFTGKTFNHLLIGNDLMEKSKGGGRAMMQYGNNYAFLDDRGVAILRPNQSPLMFDYVDGKLIKKEKQDEDLLRDALAYSFWPYIMYSEKKYTLFPNLVKLK